MFTNIFYSAILDGMLKSGKVTRSRVDIFIYDDKGRVLAEPRMSKGYVKFPGGGVESGQSVASAARQEALEEVGLEVYRPHGLGISPMTGKWWDDIPERKDPQTGETYTHYKNYVRAAKVKRKNSDILGSEGDALEKARFIDPSTLERFLKKEISQARKDGKDLIYPQMKLQAIQSIRGMSKTAERIRFIPFSMRLMHRKETC